MAWATHVIFYVAWNIVLAFEMGAHALLFWTASLLAPAWGVAVPLLNRRGPRGRAASSIASSMLLHTALGLPAVMVAWFAGVTFAWGTAEAGSYTNNPKIELAFYMEIG